MSGRGEENGKGSNSSDWPPSRSDSQARIEEQETNGQNASSNYSSQRRSETVAPTRTAVRPSRTETIPGLSSPMTPPIRLGSRRELSHSPSPPGRELPGAPFREGGGQSSPSSPGAVRGRMGPPAGRGISRTLGRATRGFDVAGPPLAKSDSLQIHLGNNHDDFEDDMLPPSQDMGGNKRPSNVGERVRRRRQSRSSNPGRGHASADTMGRGRGLKRSSSHSKTSLRDLFSSVRGLRANIDKVQARRGLFDSLVSHDDDVSHVPSSGGRGGPGRGGRGPGRGGGLIRSEMASRNIREAILVDLAEAFELGVEVHKKDFRGQTFEVFIGSDAVDWMLKAEFAFSRSDAEALGQELLRELNLFEHVPAGLEFYDDYNFYRFTEISERTYPAGFSVSSSKLAQRSVEDIPQSELKELGAKFKAGIKPGTYYHRKVKFDNSFPGDLAVDWMVDSSLAASRREAVRLGQRLQEELGLFDHVQKAGESRKKFMDDRNFYRFVDGREGKMMRGPSLDEVLDEECGERVVLDVVRIKSWASSFRRVDPRQQILDFFVSVDQIRDNQAVEARSARSLVTHLRSKGFPMSPRVFSTVKASVFSIFRPTSVDAIRKMMMGQAVGKGLDIKGKSAKRGKLSAFVPFLQISDNKHKDKIRTLPPSDLVRIFFSSADGRQAVTDRLEIVGEEMVDAVEDAKDMLEDMLQRSKDGAGDDPSQELDEVKKALTFEMEDPTIHFIDEYAPNCYGLEIPSRLFWEAFVVRQDISRKKGSQYDTGRPSIPAFQDKNFGALRAVPTNGSPKAVLWQNAGGSPETAMNPLELLMAYEEHGQVFPVVSDFDAFLVGSQRISFHQHLPQDQVDVLKWCVNRIEDILAAPGPESWTSRWLEKLENPWEGEEIHPVFPRFGFGDPISYSIMEEAANKLTSGLTRNGAVRHGAECFNYYFPQDLDDEFLVISESVPGENHWQYMNASQVKQFLRERVREGFTFPLNPKWILCDGWGDLYDDLMSSDRAEVRESMDTWFPPDSGLREQIAEIRDRYPRGFLRQQRRKTVADLGSSVLAAVASSNSAADRLNSVGPNSSEDEIERSFTLVVKGIRETPIPEEDTYDYEDHMENILGCLERFPRNEKIQSNIFYLLEMLAKLDITCIIGNSDGSREMMILKLVGQTLMADGACGDGAMNALNFLTSTIPNVFPHSIQATRLELGPSVLHAIEKNPSSIGIQAAGLSAFVLLCSRHGYFPAMLIDNHGIEIVVKAMKDHESEAEIQRHACALIAQLTLYETGQEKLGQLGAVEVLVKALMLHPESTSIQNESLAAIQNLALAPGIHPKLYEVGAEDAIVYSMWINLKDHEVEIHALRALANVVFDYGKNKATMMRKLTLQIVMAAMNRYKGKEEMQLTAISLLKACITSDVNQKVMSDARETLSELLSCAAENFTSCYEDAQFLLKSIGDGHQN